MPGTGTLRAGIETMRETAKGPNYHGGAGNPFAAQHRKTGPPRIVLLDDNDVMRDMVAMAIREWFKDLTLLSFADCETAWQELLRTDPDLLITDIVHGGVDGLELVSMLAERRVKYPILVTSGNSSEKEVLRRAGPDLNVAYLRKPYSLESFYRQLLIHVGLSDNPEWESRKLSTRKVKVLIAWGDLHESAFKMLLPWRFGQAATFSFTVANDVEEMLGLASREHFDICLLHIWGCFMGGLVSLEDLNERAIAAAKALKARGVRRVIASSQYYFGSHSTLLERLRQAGADHFIDFPFAVEEYLAAVGKCLNLAASQSRSPAGV